MFWFGILEDLDRSLELLSFQLNLPPNSLALPKSNSNRAPSAKPSAESVEKLESLMPQDIWVYEYAKRVFEARWEYFKTGSFKPPNRPPFPKVQCLSTRFILKCNGGPYKGENWQPVYKKQAQRQVSLVLKKSRQATGQRFLGPNFRQESKTGF